MSFYDDASWLLVPSGIEEDVVYAQKPISGLGDLTFTRASDATYTDASGVVRRSPYNLAQYSQDFRNVAEGGATNTWTPNDTIILSTNNAAPNGTLTATRIRGTSGGNKARQEVITGISGLPYTGSLFIRRVSGTATIQLRVGDVGTFSTINPTSNWERFTYTTTPTSTIVRLAIVFTNDTDEFEIWGAQLVEGTSALDYFPTTNRQDVPRIDFRNADGTLSSCGRLLLEPQRTNSIRNSSMVGAVAGSPGTTPTNWGINPAGLTQTIVGIGTENGLPYIDLRFNGVATGLSLLVNLESTTQIAASNGQNWTNSFYFKSIEAPNPPNFYNSYIVQRVSGSAGGAFTQAFTPTTNLERYNHTVTTNNALITHIQPYFLGSLTIGATYDFTIRIAAPQMELGAYATTWIPTTTAAVTRIADVASKTGVSSLIGQTEGTLFVDIIPTDVSTTNAIGINAASTTGRVIIFTGGNLIFGQVRVGGVTQFSVNTSATVGVRYKAAIAYKENDIAFYVNGSQISVSNTATVPACSVISYDAGGGISPFLGRNNQAAIFPTRLTNAQLAQLTTL